MQMHYQPRCNWNANAMHPYLTLYKTSTVERWIMGISRSRSRLRRTAPAPQPQQKNGQPDLERDNNQVSAAAQFHHPHNHQVNEDRLKRETPKYMWPTSCDGRLQEFAVRSPNQRWVSLHRGWQNNFRGWLTGPDRSDGLLRRKVPVLLFKKNRPPPPPKNASRGGFRIQIPHIFPPLFLNWDSVNV